ncbi:MAG: cytochrome b/b6 domain-containing protein [Negativicutes bacterium]|nr:cytochrome b/b6 domain-containing protein [Negativicutes bacterium]
MKELHQPLSIRINHWVMAISAVILTITGFHLSQPFSWLAVKMSMVRKVHFIFGFIALANLVSHIAFYVITKTYNDILLRWRDIKDMPSFLKYFLFLSEPHPNFGKYNPGQRLIFCSWALVLIIGGTAGLAAYFPQQAAFVTKLSGGPTGIKWVKYLTAVYFAATIPLHLYLVFSEDPAKLQAIFTGYVRKEK